MALAESPLAPTWGDATFSDCVVRLVVSQNGGETTAAAGGAAAEQQDEEEVMEVAEVLNLHCVILASGSEYFRKALCSFRNAPPEQQQQRRQQTEGGGDADEPLGRQRQRARHTAQLDERLTAQEVPHARALLRFLYTRRLPEGADLGALGAMVQRADYWLMDGAREACQERMAQLLTRDTLADAFAKHCRAFEEVPEVHDAALEVMDGVLSSGAAAVMRSSHDLEWFQRLPAGLLELWRRERAGATDDNAWLALLAAWHDRTSEPVTTAMFGLDRCSASYALQVLPRMACVGSSVVTRALRDSAEFVARMAAGDAGCRTDPRAQLLSMTQESVRALWEDDTMRIKSPHFFAGGYSWRFKWHVQDRQPRFFLRAALPPGWCALSVDDLHVRADVTLLVGTTSHRRAPTEIPARVCCEDKGYAELCGRKHNTIVPTDAFPDLESLLRWWGNPRRPGAVPAGELELGVRIDVVY